jgi:hypothetical protein
MLLAPSVFGLFKWRQFDPAVLLLAVGWYLRFSLSNRDVEGLLANRSVHADHVTAWRWVQCHAPQMQRRLRSRLNSNNDSWRMDENHIQVKSKWVLSLWLALPRVAKFSFGEALALVDNRRLWGRALLDRYLPLCFRARFQNQTLDSGPPVAGQGRPTPYPYQSLITAQPRGK